MSDFATSFGQLRTIVSTACDSQEAWPAQVSAGIGAALSFVIDDPDAACTLTVDLHSASVDRVAPREMVEHFAALLGRGAPVDARPGPSTERALVGGIVTMVSGYVRAGSAERLGELAPELVYLTLLPYLGFAEAQHWAEAGNSAHPR